MSAHTGPNIFICLHKDVFTLIVGMMLDSTHRYQTRCYFGLKKFILLTLLIGLFMVMPRLLYFLTFPKDNKYEKSKNLKVE